MSRKPTDFSKSLEELFDVRLGDPSDAPTPLVAEFWSAWTKPLCQLSDEEVGLLVAQQDGDPFILDLVWPRLTEDPLYMSGDYPGDLLSALLRADDAIWNSRPGYKVDIEVLYARALARPPSDKQAFLESLGLSEGPLH